MITFTTTTTTPTTHRYKGYIQLQRQPSPLVFATQLKATEYYKGLITQCT